MKKIMSSCMCVLMLVGFIAFPANATNEMPFNELEISEAEYNEPVDPSSPDRTVIEIQEPVERQMSLEAANEPCDIPNITLPVTTLDYSDQTISMMRRSNNQTYQFSGVIDQENGMFTIYPITLYNNQNMHAELIGPSDINLNYDLRLYEMNVNTGELTSLVDICAYGKSAASAVLPQTVATLNTSSSAKNYALIVYARTGYSGTDFFDANLTLGAGGDPAESNDNAFTASSFGNLGVNGIAVQGTTLDSPKDVDWFYFNVDNLTEFDKVKIRNNENSNLKFQLYYLESGTTFVEIEPINGFYQLKAGLNYLRVTDNGNDFSVGDICYSPVITVSFKPAKISSQFRMNEYTDLPTQTYRVWNASETEYWPETRYALLSSCRLEWTATFLSSSNYICRDATNKLHIDVTNTSWDPVQFQHASAVSGEPENGVVTCVLEKSVGCRGVYPGVSGMSYDTACTLNMWAEDLGSITGGDMPIFITFRIMS